MSTGSNRFGSPTLTEAERKAAIKRAEHKWCPRTRFIANAVPPHVLQWLIAHEEAVTSGAAKPPIPPDVFGWFEDRGISFAAGRIGEAVAAEKVAEVAQPTPGQLSHTCTLCGASFAAKRRDAKFCSTRCQVAAHRARVNPIEPYEEWAAA